MKTISDLMDKSIRQLNDIKAKLHDHSEEGMAINIIIDNADPQNPVFIEIETDQGKSICIGEEMECESGYRKLRITTSHIINHNDT